MKAALLSNKGKKTILIQLLSGKIFFFFFFFEETQKKKRKKGGWHCQKEENYGDKNVGNRNTVRFGPLTNFLDFFNLHVWVSPS